VNAAPQRGRCIKGPKPVSQGDPWMMTWALIAERVIRARLRRKQRQTIPFLTHNDRPLRQFKPSKAGILPHCSRRILAALIEHQIFDGYRQMPWKNRQELP